MASDAFRETIPQFALIERECFSEPWSEKMLTESYDSGQYVFVSVYDGGTAAGYACGSISFDEGEIQRICVLPGYRRRGYGYRLMNELESAMSVAGCKTVFLEVRSRNEAAIALYEKIGFEKTGLRKNYYGDDDAVIYKHSIEFTEPGL